METKGKSRDIAKYICNKNLKHSKEKGITLIALVITVIILVILAAVSINAVFDSKTVEYATNGAQGYEYQAINENNILIGSGEVIGDAIIKIEEAEEGSYDVWDGSSSTEPTEKTDTGIHIYTAAELKWLADEVNGGETFDGYTIYLESNLNFGAKETNGEWETSENEAVKWTPIGSKDNDSSYRLNATFEGNNHIIKGIYVNQDTKFAGLFGNASSISNLTIKDSYIRGTNNWVGGIVATTRRENSIISNCHNVNTTVVLENESAQRVRRNCRAINKYI